MARNFFLLFPRVKQNLHYYIDQQQKIIQKKYGQNPNPTIDYRSANDLQKILYLDISNIARHDNKTGIPRVTRAIINSMLNLPVKGYKIKLIYGLPYNLGYYYADLRKDRQCHELVITKQIVSWGKNDILFFLDFARNTVLNNEEIIEKIHAHGVKMFFLIHDLLPYTHPEYFPEKDYLKHKAWLSFVANFDGVICISKVVKQEYLNFLKKAQLKTDKNFHIAVIHHAANVMESLPSYGLPKKVNELQQKISNDITFLMVGTIVPRKGYLQTLKAFNLLWENSVKVNLVIVGEDGWKNLHHNDRKEINEIMKLIKKNYQLNKRLFWLNGISDEFLVQLYKTCTCLFFASEAEGFGLPLIEAAHYNMAVIARDISIHHEVLGNHAYYFSGLEPDDISSAITHWLKLYKSDQHPKTTCYVSRTWEQVAQEMLDFLLLPDVSKVAKKPMLNESTDAK